jgi:hypothetical protein
MIRSVLDGIESLPSDVLTRRDVGGSICPESVGVLGVRLANYRGFSPGLLWPSEDDGCVRGN